MAFFVARQPILDPNAQIVAYELLFRSGIENAFKHEAPTHASANVIVNSTLLMDLDKLCAGRRAFVNATRQTLLDGHMTMLPPEQTAVEVLETIEPDNEVVAACRDLKTQGYWIVLDDYIHDQRYLPLLEIADIIKVDVAGKTPEQLKAEADMLLPMDISLLAEKVETSEVQKLARDLGFEYFQGYFFAKPEIVSSKEVPGFKINYLMMIDEINRAEMDVRKLEMIIRRDMSICYRLLRHINSVHYGLRSTIQSINHAIVYLGHREFRKWASLIAMASMARECPPVLVIHSMARAKFCEFLARPFHMSARSPELFLMGMFSMLDAILGRPLSELMENLPVEDDVKAALALEDCPLAQVYRYVLAYEAGEWKAVAEIAEALRLDESTIPDGYIESASWAIETYQEISDMSVE